MYGRMSLFGAGRARGTGGIPAGMPEAGGDPSGFGSHVVSRGSSSLKSPFFIAGEYVREKRLPESICWRCHS